MESGTDPARPVPSVWKRQILLHAYVGETLLLTGVMVVINLAFLPGKPGFLGVEPNPFWVPVLLMAARYGFRAGLLSSLICAGTYLGLLSVRVRDQLISFRDLFGWSYAKPAVLFIAGGVVLGMLVERHRQRGKRLQQENEALSAENQELARGEKELRDVNVELASRVVGATETLPLLYKYAKRLNDLDVDQIYTALTDLVVEVIRAGRCAVYLVESESSGRFPLHSENGQRSQGGGTLVLEAPLRERVIGKRQVVTLHDLLALRINRPDLYLCGPLSAGAGGEGQPPRVSALLCVHEIEFLRYNPATLRLFRVIVDWACASLEKAGQYSGNPEQLRLARSKATLLRARSISLAPGVIPATAPPIRPTLPPIAAGIDDEPTEREQRPAAPGGPLGSVPAGVGETPLSRVLGEASQRLFGEDGLQSEPPLPVAPGEGPSLGELQALLHGELQVASSQGSPLAKLLAEIDGFIAVRGRPIG